MSEATTEIAAFEGMLDQHNRMWTRAGWSNSGMVISDSAPYDLRLAREASKRLVELFAEAIKQRDAWAHAISPQSEPLNSTERAKHD